MLSDCRLVRMLKDSGKSWRQVHIVAAPPHCPPRILPEIAACRSNRRPSGHAFCFAGRTGAGSSHHAAPGRWVRHRFRITKGRIMDARMARPNVRSRPPRLALVTCWPLDSPVPGGPLRFVLFADLIATSCQHHQNTIPTGLRQHSRTQNRHNWVLEPSSFQNNIRLKCILGTRAREEKADEDLSLFGAGRPI